MFIVEREHSTNCYGPPRMTRISLRIRRLARKQADCFAVRSRNTPRS